MDLVAPGPAELARWRSPISDEDPRHHTRSPAASAAWNGVVWGRLGRGDLAWQWWDTVEEPALQAWIAGERGRLLREYGLHALAREVDQDGLRQADDLVDMVLLRLSLAADAVGLGEEAAARRALGTASALLDELPDGDRPARQRLRRTWVEVEIALLSGGTPPTEGLPWWEGDGPEFPDDHAAGTDFHSAKGLLFAGVVHGDDRLLAAAAELAPPALRWAVALARLDAGDADAGRRARRAWRQLVPPPELAAEVEAGPTAVRMERLGRDGDED